MHDTVTSVDTETIARIASLSEFVAILAERRSELHALEDSGRATGPKVAAEINENLVSALEAERQIRDLTAELSASTATAAALDTAVMLATGHAARRTALRRNTADRRARKLESRERADRAARRAKIAARAAHAESRDPGNVVHLRFP
jgi:DNA repair exonuclease SbcCD ATPase subunit